MLREEHEIAAPCGGSPPTEKAMQANRRGQVTSVGQQRSGVAEGNKCQQSGDLAVVTIFGL